MKQRKNLKKLNWGRIEDFKIQMKALQKAKHEEKSEEVIKLADAIEETTTMTYTSTNESIRLVKRHDIINFIREKGSTSSLVSESNWVSFPTPKK